MKKSPSRGFTIIELLVVVSIIALLVGILLPAIGKARDQAQLTKSQSNIKQLGTAAQTYSAEYNDRQLTYCNDYLSRYGTGAASVDGYYATVGYEHPAPILGYGQGGIWGFFLPPFGPNGNYIGIVPVDFSSSTKFGSFRLLQPRQFSAYLNGRFYDPVYYAPKDTAVMASVEPWFNQPDEYISSAVTNGTKYTSYIMSPAAMFSPDVLAKNKTTGLYYTNPWSMEAGHRSPSMSQALYPDLKTHIIEHHWLQKRKKVCHPSFTGSPYDGCQPYFFNGSVESAPVCLFYDGHVEMIGQRSALEANQRVANQNGAPSNGGLWSVDTPWAGCYQDGCNGGYYMEFAADWTSTSYHILTIDGIRGRDITPQ